MMTGLQVSQRGSRKAATRGFRATLLLSVICVSLGCSGSGEGYEQLDPQVAGPARKLPSVRVLFVLNTGGPPKYGFVPTEATTQAWIHDFNNVLKASVVSTNDVLVWAGFAELGWDVADDVQMDVALARSRKGAYEEIWNARDALKADVVVVYSALNRLGVRATASSPVKPVHIAGISSAYWEDDAELGRNNAFAFVNLGIGFPQQVVFEKTVHEVGHLLGANHEPPQVEGDKAKRYDSEFRAWATDAPGEANRGFVNAEAGFMTVMSYGRECKSPSCTRSPILFSNPHVWVTSRGPEFPAGTPEQDNVTTMQRVIPIVAAYY